jgi:ABC-type glycerol-3-phosphate transport system substrate-binding protein
VLKAATALGLTAATFPAIHVRTRAQAEGQVNLLCFAGEVATAIRTLSEEFMAENPNIQINLEEVDSATAERRMWLDFAAQGGAYDVVIMLNFWFGRAITEDDLMPIDSYIESDPKELNLGDYPAPVIGTTQFGGQNFGFPVQAGDKLIYYRIDKFEESGIAIPAIADETWNWEDYLAAAQALNDPDAGFYGNSPGGSSPVGLTWNWAQYLHTNGVPMFGQEIQLGSVPEAGEDLRPNLNNETSIQYLNHLKELFAVANPGASAQADDEGTNVFLQGNSAMVEQWGDVGPRVFDPAQTTLTPDQVGYAPIPMGTSADARQAPFFAMWSSVLSRFAKNPDAAYEFMSWLSLKDLQFAELGGIPCRESTYNDPAMLERFPHYEVINATMPFAQSLPSFPEWTEVSDAVGQAAQRVILGAAEPEAVIEEAQAAVDQILIRAGYYE